MAREHIDAEVSGTPNIEGKHTTVISDRQASRAWSGEGRTVNEATADAIKRLLGDRRAREYME